MLAGTALALIPAKEMNAENIGKGKPKPYAYRVLFFQTSLAYVSEILPAGHSVGREHIN